MNDDLSSMLMPIAMAVTSDPLQQSILKVDFEQRLAVAQRELKRYLREGYQTVASGIITTQLGQEMYIILYKAGDAPQETIARGGIETTFMQRGKIEISADTGNLYLQPVEGNDY
jgi:hypothetical protein